MPITDLEASTDEDVNIDDNQSFDFFGILTSGTKMANRVWNSSVTNTSCRIACRVFETAAATALACFNAAFYWGPAQKYAKTTYPDSKFAEYFFPASATLANLLFALNASLELFKEFHTPNGRPGRLVAALILGAISASPTFFMHLMEAETITSAVIAMALAVSIGNVPVQALGMLNFLKVVGPYAGNHVKSAVKACAGKSQDAIELEIAEAFLTKFGAAIAQYIAESSAEINFNLPPREIIEQIFNVVVVNDSQASQFKTGLLEKGSFVIGGAFALAAIPGSTPPVISTYLGILSSLKKIPLQFAQGISGVVGLGANFAPTILAMVYGCRTAQRLWGYCINLLSDLGSSAWNREWKINLPIDMKIAKVGALVAVILGIGIASGSYATAIRLLNDTLNIAKDPAHPNLIVISKALFKAFESLIKIRVITLNATGVVNVLFQFALGITQLIDKQRDPDNATRIRMYESLQAMLAMWADAPSKEFAQELLKTFDNDTLARFTKIDVSRIQKARTPFWQQPNVANVSDQWQALLSRDEINYGTSQVAYQLQPMN